MIIKNLISGGLITNYYCTSRCQHCLYACSPKWQKKYIDIPTLELNLRSIKSLGCNSIHIGGGEPFLDIPALKNVIQTCNKENIFIEYIETNSSWYKEADAYEILSQFKKLGINTLLISISPYHNEYIPFKKVKGLMNTCDKTGIHIFPWIQNFFYDINSLDENKSHSLNEYKEKYGTNYFINIPARYGVRLGGRAVISYKDILPKKKLSEILDTEPCIQLTDTTHFHIDLFGNYIPGLCSGFTIEVEDLKKTVDENKYTFINILYNEGIKAFLNLVQNNYNFEPQESYLSKCHLCIDIRKYLVIEKKIQSPELNPEEFYSNL